MLLLEVISGELDHWPWESQSRGAVMPEAWGLRGPGSGTAPWVLPLWECCPDTSASALSLAMVALGVLKKVGGDV